MRQGMLPGARHPGTLLRGSILSILKILQSCQLSSPLKLACRFTLTGMSVVIPDEILLATRMSEAEFRLELAVMLFEREKLTLAQASRLAEIGQSEFQHVLAGRHISPHYGVVELHEDVDTLGELGRR